MELPIPGSAVVFKAWGKREPSDYDVVEFIFDPGFAGPQPHVHRKHEELWYSLEGQFDFLVGDQAMRIEPGSFIHVPPGVVHDFRNAGSGRARLLLVSSPHGLDHYFEEMAALGAEGNFSESALNELRLKYDTDEVDVTWAV